MPVTLAPWRHEIERPAQVVLQLAPIDDRIEHAMFEQKLRPLKTLRQLLPDRLLNDAGPGEGDERPRLGNIQITQHAKARGHAASCRVGQYRKIGHLCIVQERQGTRNLGQLHQAHDAFHHPRTARSRDDDERMPRGERPVNGASNRLTHYRAHAAADEGVLHHAQDDGMMVEMADGIDDSVVQPGFVLGLAQACFIGLQIDEIKGIGRLQLQINKFEAGFKQTGNTLPRAQSKVLPALRDRLAGSLPDRPSIRRPCSPRTSSRALRS